jgi:hypothetical protein
VERCQEEPAKRRRLRLSLRTDGRNPTLAETIGTIVVREESMTSGGRSRFRARAKQCQTLAIAAHDEDARRSLSAMAQELDDEADKIEAEEAAQDGSA